MAFSNTECHRNFAEIAKKKVVDAEDTELGIIQDIVFDEKFNPISFIIGGSIWEELAEKIGLKKDHDPVVPIENIEKIDTYVKLNVSKDALDSKLESSAIPKNVHYFENLKEKIIIDRENKEVGKIINVVFLPCREISFIVRGSPLNAIGKALGISPHEWDLLLPSTYITNIIEDKIKIDVVKKDLEEIVNQQRLSTKESVEYLDSLKKKRVVSLKAISARYTV